MAVETHNLTCALPFSPFFSIGKWKMLACRARAKNVWNLTLPEGHYMLQIVTLLGHVVFTY